MLVQVTIKTNSKSYQYKITIPEIKFEPSSKTKFTRSSELD